MVEGAVRSDVLDAVAHEHTHLRRLFEDISETFQEIRDSSDPKHTKQEAVAMASENLEMALEEMLEHFDEEEEILFVEIEKRFPDLKDEIAQLVDSHEQLCDRTRWLKQKINSAQRSIFEELGSVLAVVDEVKKILDRHTRDEQQLFETVLEGLPEGERKWLLKEMRHI